MPTLPPISLEDVAPGTHTSWTFASRLNALLPLARAGRNIITYNDVAGVLADTSPGLAEGTRLLTAKGYAYEVAPDAATDHQLTTAGGKKLYVLPGAGGVSVGAYGASPSATGAANSAAIQAALNAGPGTVFLEPGLFAISTGLTIPAGVTLRGGGLGTTPLTNPAGRGGSTLVYSGAGVAVSLQGSNAALEGVRVEGTSAAAGGLFIDGNARVVESWRLRDVLVFGFSAGYGLHLRGEDQGAVAYGTVDNLRIRNARTGLWIYDANSILPHTGDFGFVNTNQFYGGAINGGGFDDCILIQGGNDNRIRGMSVEPYTSTNGHIRMIRGSLDFDGRLEAVNQPSTSPVIDIAAGCGGRLAGFYAGGMIRNAGYTAVDFQGQKWAPPNPVAGSRFRNSAFKGADLTARTIPHWTVTETGGASTWTRLSPDVVPDHEVLEITVPASGSVEIRQSRTLGPEPFVNFGLWVMTAFSGLAYARYNAPAGVVTSSFHGGGNVWAPVSMRAIRATTGSDDPRFVLSGGASGASFRISAPYFSLADRADPVRYITEAGGFLAGMIEGGGATVTLPAAGSNEFYDSATGELTLPKWGNLFVIAGTARPISRINNLTASRVAQFTKVDLVFSIASVAVNDNAYIDLRSAFTSAAGSHLSLYANSAAGTWAELSRA